MSLNGPNAIGVSTLEVALKFMLGPKPHLRVGVLAVVQRQRKVIDASVAGLQIDQQALIEDVRVIERKLLRSVSGWTSKDVPAARNLQTGARAKCRRNDAGDLVIGVAAKEQVVLVKVVIDARVEDVAARRAVWADNIVVRQLTDAAGIRCRKQLQVGKRDRVDLVTLGTRSSSDQRCRRSTCDAVDVVVLVDRRNGALVGDAVYLAKTFIITEEETCGP